jgi:hypothetical protein
MYYWYIESDLRVKRKGSSVLAVHGWKEYGRIGKAVGERC